MNITYLRRAMTSAAAQTCYQTKQVTDLIQRLNNRKSLDISYKAELIKSSDIFLKLERVSLFHYKIKQ